MSDCELRSDGIDDVLHDSHAGDHESFQFWLVSLDLEWCLDERSSSGNSDRSGAELDLELCELNGPSHHAIDSVQLELWIVGPVHQIAISET